jgi:hypothetical protein
MMDPTRKAPGEARSRLWGAIRLLGVILCAMLLLFFLIPDPPSYTPFRYEASDRLVPVLVLHVAISALLQKSVVFRLSFLILGSLFWYGSITTLVESWNILIGS